MKRKVLLTGAAGRIGRLFLERKAEEYDFRLADVDEMEETHGFPFHQIDISDMDVVLALCEGIDTVVHLAADPRMDASWETLLPSNVIGAYNVFEAAQRSGCRRVVFASSVNAVFGYPEDMQVRTDMPVSPINLYGATKCWGEALGRYYANARNLSVHCLRFGAVQHPESNVVDLEHRYIDIILTFEDCVRLITAAAEAPDDVHFGIFHGVSENRYKRLDLTDTRARLDYRPQDDSFELAQRKAQVERK